MTNKYLYRAGAVISTVSLLATSFAGMAGASVDGTATNDTTGADSYNESKIEVEQNTFVNQNNSGYVENQIKLNANTGNNSANKNTGEGHVETGDVATGVGISNTLNKNVADVAGCGGCDLDLTASNEKTGADSDNKTKIDVEKNTVLEQNNKAQIENHIFQDLDTGNNKANKNTGMGSIETGDVESTSLVSNLVNKNAAHVGSGGGTAVLSATNDTTGADSTNKAKVDVDLNNWVVQSNNADIDNHAVLFANTGWNKANKNTGEGDITTGDIDTGIGFETLANANFLAFDGCCDIEFDLGNEKTGADSYNKAKAELDSTNTVFQGNCQSESQIGDLDFGGHHHGRKCGVKNSVYGDLNTGENKTNENTADGIDSGDVEAGVEVVTEENKNVLGSSVWDWPEVELGDVSEGAWWMLFFGVSA